MNKSKFFILIIILIHTSELMSQKIDIDILQGKTTNHLVGDSILLEKETFKAFEKMKREAFNDGIRIKIVSGHRDFERQTLIWNSKFIKFTKEFKLKPEEAINEIVRFSTVPGTSRHHWGTDIDIIDGNYPDENDVLIVQAVGRMIYKIEDNQYILFPGDSLFISAGTYHEPHVTCPRITLSFSD